MVLVPCRQPGRYTMTTVMPTRALPERLASIATALALLLTAGLAALHVRMVLSPAPQEMREGATVWLTQLLLDGRNPYDFNELPASTNVYGIFYHLVVWPFALLFGNSFQVHRVVSALAIVIAAALMYRLLRRLGTDRGLALVGTLLFYVSSLYFVAPLARPDGLGICLCVASLTLLFEQPLTPLRFAGGVGLALLALTTKIPLAFPPFVLAAYVFLFQSRRQGLVLGLTSIAAAAGALLLLVLRVPDVHQSLPRHELECELRRRATPDWTNNRLADLQPAADGGPDRARRGQRSWPTSGVTVCLRQHRQHGGVSRLARLASGRAHDLFVPAGDAGADSGIAAGAVVRRRGRVLSSASRCPRRCS